MVDPLPPRRRRRPPVGLVSLGSLLLLGGCQELKSDQYLLVWLLVPLLGFLGAGGLFVYTRRSRQLDTWDLQKSPMDAGVAWILTKLVWTAAAAFVVFAVYNLYLQGTDWTLKLLNIGLWLLGSAVGALSASFLGLRLAESKLLSSQGPRAALPPRRS